MQTFAIALIGLWICPPAALYILYATRHRLNVRKRLIGVSIIISVVTLTGMAAQVYTRWESANCIMFMQMYLAASLLLIFAYQQKHLIVKIISAVLMIALFGAGYLLSTIGILGLGFILGDIDADRSIPLTNSLTYKQYNRGNAISDYRNVEVSVRKTYKWLPFLESEVFTKTYNVYFIPEAKATDLGKNEIYGYNFKVYYDKPRQQLILNDSLRVYKLHVEP